MANSNEQTPAPAGADAGPQSGTEGAGGEPKGTRLQGHDRPAPHQEAEADKRRPGHSSDKDQPGYRARPAGQSGLGEQPDRPSPLREPQGEGNYIATDRGDQPLRNG